MLIYIWFVIGNFRCDWIGRCEGEVIEGDEIDGREIGYFGFGFRFWIWILML